MTPAGLKTSIKSKQIGNSKSCIKVRNNHNHNNDILKKKKKHLWGTSVNIY